jgi:hypothetical protein
MAEKMGRRSTYRFHNEITPKTHKASGLITAFKER